MGPVRTSLEIFDKVGMGPLRERSQRLTGYLAGLLDQITPTRPLRVITPADPARRGCQLSIRIGVSARSEPGLRAPQSRTEGIGVSARSEPGLRAPQSRTEGGTPGSAAELARRLRHEYGVVADAREPDVVRLAPVPLYSTYHDCWRAVDALARLVEEVR